MLVARAGIEPATFRFSGGRSCQLSYLARRHRCASPPLATLTGLEPATSAVTGRRANQLRHRALLLHLPSRAREAGTPYGIRTRATALKGRRPRPLDEGGHAESLRGTRNANHAGSFDSLGYRHPNPQTRCPSQGSILSEVAIHIAPIAQLVELRTFNPQVPGSSPGGGTSRCVLPRLMLDVSTSVDG